MDGSKLTTAPWNEGSLKRPGISVHPYVGLAIGFVALGVVASQPLVCEFGHSLPARLRNAGETRVLTREPTDTLQLYYHLWLVRDSLLGRTPMLYDPYQFRVDGPRWNLSQTFPLLGATFAVLSVFGPIAAYNLLVLLSFPAAGLAAFALVRQYTADAWSAAAAGIIFALAPSRLFALFAGQSSGFAAPLLPLVFWWLELALQGRVGPALAAGVGVSAIASLEPHYAYVLTALIPTYVVLRAVTAERPRARLLAPLLVFGCFAAVGVAWLWELRRALLVGSVMEGGRTLAEIRFLTPGPAAAFAPSTYGGVSILALALLGAVVPGPRGSRTIRSFFGAAAVLTLLVTLGPSVPGFPLYEMLHRWAPFFAFIRYPEKFRIFVSLGAAVLGGYALSHLRVSQLALRTRWLGVGLLALMLLETVPWRGIVLVRTPDNPLYRVLPSQAGRILYLPIAPGDSIRSSVFLYDATRTRVPMLNGYSPVASRRYTDQVYDPLRWLNVGELSSTEYQVMRRLGVTHVVLDRVALLREVTAFPPVLTWFRLQTSSNLALRGTWEPFWLFQLADQPSSLPAPTSPVGVFWEAEMLSGEAGEFADDTEASGGRVVAGRRDRTRAGTLVITPASPIPSGRYRATVRARGGGLRLEVVATGSATPIAATSLGYQPSWMDTALSFELTRAANVDFRVSWNGSENAAIDWILLVFAERPEPEWLFEFCQLRHRLAMVPDPTASAGCVSHLPAVVGERRESVHGPTRVFPAGRYRLLLHGRRDGEGRGTLLGLAVAEPAGRVFASRVVQAEEMPTDRIGKVSLDFELSRAMVLDFPVSQGGDTGIFLDRLEVVRR